LDELFERSKEFWKEKYFYDKAVEERKTEKYLKKVLTVERERLSKLSEVGEGNRFFFQDIDYDKELLNWKNMTDEEIEKSLEISKKILENLNEKDFENLEKITEALMSAAEKNYKTPDGKVDRGALLWPLRVALTGEKKSPSPFEAAWVLGKEESLKRINKAIEKI
jgi:glutamyl/glutaminyl-tRNA synthetase